MPEHDDPGDQLRQEFLRQDPGFDLGPSLPARVSALIRRRRRRRLIATTAVIVAVMAAVALPLASLRSSSGPKSFNPAGGSTTSTTRTSVPSVATTSPPTTTTPPTTTSPPTSGTTVTATTVVNTYNPWATAGTLNPDFHVVGHLTDGSCFDNLGYKNYLGQTSVADSSIADANNESAWRCTTDQGTQDPCFAPPGTSDVTELACALNPYLRDDVYLLAMSQPLPSSSTGDTPMGSWPMVLELQNGEQCEVIQGTATQGNYGCTDGSTSNPSTASEPWTVSYWPAGSHTAVTTAVTAVWQ
jgi:hypothetical protein